MEVDGHTGRKTCPIAIFSTTNLAWTDPEINPGLLGDTPATKPGAAGWKMKSIFMVCEILARTAQRTGRPHCKDGR